MNEIESVVWGWHAVRHSSVPLRPRAGGVDWIVCVCVYLLLTYLLIYLFICLS